MWHRQDLEAAQSRAGKNLPEGVPGMRAPLGKSAECVSQGSGLLQNPAQAEAQDELPRTPAVSANRASRQLPGEHRAPGDLEVRTYAQGHPIFPAQCDLIGPPLPPYTCT